MWFDAVGSETTIFYAPDAEDAILTLFEGGCNAGGTAVACANDNGPAGMEALTINTVPGTRYRIRIENLSGNTDMSGAVCVFGMNVLGLAPDDLKAACTGERVTLTWSAPEQNEPVRFAVEKSSDATGWRELGTVSSGLHGNGGRIACSFTDINYGGALTYYRVIRYSPNGDPLVSGIVTADCGDQTAIRMFPNPATDLIHLSYKSMSETTVVFSDLCGRIVRSLPLERAVEPVSIVIRVEDIPSGIYIYSITTDAGVKSGTISIQH
jgi:hypothetical protein